MDRYTGNSLWVYIFFLSYCIGSIPFGFIIGKIKGKDIRKEGSKNVGATNVVRVCGQKWGYLCFLLDFLKGFFPVLIMKYWGENNEITLLDYFLILSTIGAVSGHIWSPFLGFRGGKGVATSIGAITAIAPICALISFFTWCSIFSVSRYVSLASILSAIVLPLIAWGLSVARLQSTSPTMIFFLFVLSLGVVIKHKDNIYRLFQGKEHRFVSKK